MPDSGAPAPAEPLALAPWPQAYPFTPYGRFLAWLKNNQDEIIDEWVERLGQLSPAYRRRPTAELYGTVINAFRANAMALENGDLGQIERFIDFITQKRLQAGFPLSDVQKAFELFREIVVARLCTPALSDLLAESVPQINACLAYTIHRFSDYFQKMHERSLRRHAANLERKVRTRTAELAESEKRYKTLVNEINDGYFVVQGERIVFANRAFRAMHGAREEGVVGRPFFHFVAPGDRHRVMEALWEGLAKRSPEGQLEYSRSGRPPEDAVTEIRYKVVDLGQGPVTIGICRDISQRVAMEATIREHERMAYVGHVAASLSHEIRNPLSTCTLNMMILNDKLDLSGFDRRRLEITVRELTRLEDILKQLLDLARPLSLETEAVELRGVAADCVDLLPAKWPRRASPLGSATPRRWPRSPPTRPSWSRRSSTCCSTPSSRWTRGAASRCGPAWSATSRNVGPSWGCTTTARASPPRRGPGSSRHSPPTRPRAPAWG